MKKLYTLESWATGHVYFCAGVLLLLLSGTLGILVAVGVIDGLIAAVDIFIAIIGGVFTLYGSFLKNVENKRSNFKESFIYMNKHYPIVARYAAEIENKRFKGECDDIVSEYTVCDRKWIPGKPMEFSDIHVRLERRCYDSPDRVTDGTKGDDPIDTSVAERITLERGTNTDRKPAHIDMLDKQWRALLPYRTKTFAQNVQLITGRNVIPYPSLALTAIEVKDDSVEMTVEMGNYDDFYNTCVFLLYELTHDVFVNGNQKVLVDLKGNGKQLRYRKKIDTRSFDNRFASIGINTLTILKNVPVDYLDRDAIKKDKDRDEKDRMFDEGKHVRKDCDKRDYFIMHIRGNDVAEGPGLYHVVPAGSYQPTEIKEGQKTVYRNMDPASTVIKEFAEEVLKEGGSNDLVSEGWLNAIREKMVHKLYFLGIALEPVNLKTEMLSVLVIDVEKTNCSEVNIIESIFHFEEDVEGKIKLMPLEKMYFDQFSDNLRTAPAGKAILGLFTAENRYDLGGCASLLEFWQKHTVKKGADGSVTIVDDPKKSA